MKIEAIAIIVALFLSISLLGSLASHASSPLFSDGNSQASVVVGQRSFDVSKSSAAQDGLEGPLSICSDMSGNLWVADTLNNRVLEYKPPFTSGMNASLVLGQSTFNSSQARTGPNGLSNPSAVACGQAGGLWIADTANNRVMEFNPPYRNGMNSSLVIGQPDFSARNSSESASGFDNPLSLALDQSGNLWVADFGNNRIMEFKAPLSNGMNASLVVGQTESAKNQTGTHPGEFSGPDAIVFDSQGSLWVSDGGGNRILEFNAPFSSNMSISMILGRGQASPKLSQDSVTGPHGLAFDQPGNLWIADFFSDRVLEFVPPFSGGMDASFVIGQANFTAYQPDQLGPGGLNGPADVAFDSHGDMWIADYHNNRVLEFPKSSLSSSKTPFSLDNLVVSLASVTILISLWFVLSHRRKQDHRGRKNTKSRTPGSWQSER